jgi:glycosyltransferase involved in cell wall biosynthesis
MISIDVRMFSNSGIGTYIKHLVPEIIAAQPNQSFALVGYPEEIALLPNTQQPRVTVIPATSEIYSIQEQLELPRLIPKETKLFWSPHYNIPVFYRGRLLVTVHDVFHLAMPQYVGGWHKRFYAKVLFSRLRQQADHILTVSEFSKQELLKFTPRGSQPITVTHLGVDESWFHHSSEPPLYERPYIIFVGNVKPNKNIRGLLEAFSLIYNDVPHDLVIVGKREGFVTGDETVAKQAEVLGQRVVFTGYVSDEYLRRYVAGATALVLPSLYEGFGLPPLEAMACGCPVIVSNVTSLPEVCGDAALYVDPNNPQNIADTMQRLLRDETLQQQLRQRGLEHIKQFTWEKCAQETLSVVHTFLRRQGSGA